MGKPFIDLMCQRVSFPKLTAPAPNAEELEKVFQAALRAPDHKQLKPWRYLIIEGDARNKLGQIFRDAALQDQTDLNETQLNKYLAMPLRAPMIIVGISTNQSHPKVPVHEQVLSCGVGIAYMLLGLQALGYGGIWRTGPLAEHSHIKTGLRIEPHETLVGFLYLGTPQGAAKNISPLNSKDYFQLWS